MLQTLHDSSDAPYYAGAINGVNNAVTQDAARRFQGDNGLKPDGQLGTNTQRVLIQKYKKLEGTTLPADATLVIHGCGKFHPIDATSGADQGNRRVEIFLFDGPVDPAPVKPCPSPGCTQYPQWVAQATEDVDLCRAFDLVVQVIDDSTPPQPLVGATVTIDAPGTGPKPTGAGGMVTFENLPGGKYTLVAQHKGFNDGAGEAVLPGATAAKSSPDDKALAGPTGTVAAAPSGIVQIQLTGNRLDVLVDWGARSIALQKRLKETISGPSFWLTDTAAPGPAKIGFVSPGDLSTWATAKVTDIPLAAASTTTKSGQIPFTPGVIDAVRLDFNLEVTIGGVKKSVLTFKQLLTITASGLLAPTKFVIDDYKIVAGTTGAAGQSPPTRTQNATRELSGAHPLLQLGGISPQKITINCEFVDATELWWATHASGDAWRWYLNPVLKGRPEKLRVLAFTCGAAPMIWFAVTTDAALAALAPSSTVQPADFVFLRPPSGVNAFPYDATKAGFSDVKHHENTPNSDPDRQNTTMQMLARYLLSAAPAARIGSLTNVRRPQNVVDQMQPTTPGPPPVPADPMEIATGFPGSFRMVGMEAAINRVTEPHLLFLPLGYDAYTSHLEGGYNAVRNLSGFKTNIASAVTLLWHLGAVDGKSTAAPDLSQRQFWLGGHSSGNLSLWTSLDKNAADVDRVISISSTPNGILFDIGVPAMTKAATARAGAGKKFEAFIISAPDMLNKVVVTKQTPPPDIVDFATLQRSQRRPNGVVLSLQAAITAGADLKLLPDMTAEPDYWKISPVTSMNPCLRRLLANWDVSVSKGKGTVNLIEDNAQNGRWFSLFFHEYAAYGGHLNGNNTWRSFFEDALGSIHPGTLTVTVTAQQGGAVISGADVKLSGPVARAGQTDSKGIAIFSGLTSGAYKVVASSTGFADNNTSATVPADGSATASLALSPPGP